MKTKLGRSLVTFLTASALAVIVSTSAGCFAVAVGAGTGAAVAYVRGQLEATLSSDYERVVQAANEAVRQLGFAKVSERKDALLDIITVRNAADKKIEIRLENLAHDLTKVRIRVGIFGDEALSMAVHDKIKANL